MASRSLPFRKISEASTNATLICAQSCLLTMLTASNSNDQEVYLKIYDKASDLTVGTDTPIFTFLIPGNTRGSGTNIPLPSGGIQLSNGLGIAITAGALDNDTTAVNAGEQIVNGAYL